jgi:hypothetical protein
MQLKPNVPYRPPIYATLAGTQVGGSWDGNVYARMAAANDTTNGAPFAQDSADWLLGGLTRNRGAGKRRFSKLLHLSDMACEGDPPIAVNPVQLDKVVLVSRGLCGSTCSFFSSHLQEFDHIRTVVVGGLQGRPQQFWSFPGGQVFGMSSINEVGTIPFASFL